MTIMVIQRYLPNKILLLIQTQTRFIHSHIDMKVIIEQIADSKLSRILITIKVGITK